MLSTSCTPSHRYLRIRLPPACAVQAADAQRQVGDERPLVRRPQRGQRGDGHAGVVGRLGDGRARPDAAVGVPDELHVGDPVVLVEERQELPQALPVLVDVAAGVDGHVRRRRLLAGADAGRRRVAGRVAVGARALRRREHRYPAAFSAGATETLHVSPSLPAQLGSGVENGVEVVKPETSTTALLADADGAATPSARRARSGRRRRMGHPSPQARAGCKGAAAAARAASPRPARAPPAPWPAACPASRTAGRRPRR